MLDTLLHLAYNGAVTASLSLSVVCIGWTLACMVRDRRHARHTNRPAVRCFDAWPRAVRPTRPTILQFTTSRADDLLPVDAAAGCTAAASSQGVCAAIPSPARQKTETVLRRAILASVAAIGAAEALFFLFPTGLPGAGA